MSDDFYRRLSLIFGFFVIMGIFAMQTFVANIEIKDLDLWLHIGMGRYIVQNGFHVPSTDILSCTVAGTPWVNHEWLFQVIVYLIYGAGGANGLIFMQVILTAVTALMLFMLGYNKEKQFFAVLIFLFTALIYQMRFTIRPDLFSLFFFVVYIVMLSSFLRSRWSVLVLFIVQVLWTNMHGFFFFGPLFVMIALFAEWVKRHVRLPWEWNTIARLEDVEYRRLKWVLGFSILACLINPLTFQGAWYPIGVLLQISGDSSIFFEHIMELKKPIEMATLWSFQEYPYYKLLIVLSLVSFIFNRKKIDFGVFLFWLVFLLFSLAAIRNMVYFAFAAYLAFMSNAADLSLDDIVPIKIDDEKFIWIFEIVLKILLVFWIAQYIVAASGHGYFDFDTYERKSEFKGVSQRNFPDKAVDFLVENRIKGNMFNEFNSGAYVVGFCFPDIKVYIDGRTELYGPDFFKHYLQIVHKQDLNVFEKDLEKYDISIVLINTVRDEGPEKVLKFLYDSTDWVLVYLDYDGCIFLKDIPQHHRVIAEHRIHLNQWKVRPLDEYRLGSRRVVPYHYVNRAFSIEAMGFPDAALDEARAALWIYPGYPEAFALTGQIFAERKKVDKAFHYFRLAVTYNPDSRKARTNLAKMYELLGRHDGAKTQYQKVIERFPDHPAAYFLLARTCIKAGDVENAFLYARAGFRMDNKAAKDILDLGDLLFENEQFPEALEMYAVALGGDNRMAKVRVKLGDTFEKMGSIEKAREEWTMALEAAETDRGREKIMNRLERIESR